MPRVPVIAFVFPTVISRVGLSRSTIYAWIAAGRFPRQVALGAGSVGWREAEIDAWIDGLTHPATHPLWR